MNKAPKIFLKMLQPTYKGEKIPQMYQLKSHFILLRYSAQDII